MSRLPVPGSDDGVWGQILNDFLLAAHQADGTLKHGSINNELIENGAISSAKLSQDVLNRIETLEDKITRATEIAEAEVTLFNIATPVEVDQVNGEGVELATRFYTTIPGEILGIRFYKGSLDYQPSHRNPTSSKYRISCILLQSHRTFRTHSAHVHLCRS